MSNLDHATALKSMLTVLHNERVGIMDGCDNKHEAALMWATACAQEAITIWRTIHPQMEREMLAELIKSSN
jgi:hypothetical protein